jgi:hypothetical protein
LGGTVVADAPKWLFGTHLGADGRVFGNVGPKTVEIVQSIHHLLTGKYLSLSGPALTRMGRWLAPSSVADRFLRATLWRYARFALRRPELLFKSLFLQNIIVMQPHDVLSNGEQDECDGRPNKTYWQGRLVSECRQEDYLPYGRSITSVPKTDSSDSDCTDAVMP